ncbi:hypothetical protein BJ878DRAFT_983 [Calycina marina]|uniref:Uncharacterized protein n=1 Tax=Calycina marina TaxID=1763456 RepID=A0A9P7ZC51_9HELO|nr:hypothetical protein BJ878DRAFT_983 [Calycina marina]
MSTSLKHHDQVCQSRGHQSLPRRLRLRHLRRLQRHLVHRLRPQLRTHVSNSVVLQRGRHLLHLIPSKASLTAVKEFSGTTSTKYAPVISNLGCPAASTCDLYYTSYSVKAGNGMGVH